jgi:hypothetical protein
MIRGPTKGNADDARFMKQGKPRCLCVCGVEAAGGVSKARKNQVDGDSKLLLVRLAAPIVLPTHALAAPALLAVAEAAALLLIPGAQRLAAKGEVLVVDDGGLNPGMGAEVHLACRGIEGLEVGDDVVVGGRFG